MGMLVLFPNKSKFHNHNPEPQIMLTNSDNEYQVITIKTDGLLVSCLYIEPGKGTKKKIAEILTDVHIQSSEIIMGDLNLNPKDPNELCRIKQFCRDEYTMHLKEETTRHHNHIDHIFVSKDIEEQVFTTCFTNFVSDHKTMVIRVGGKGNTTAKQRI